MHHLLWAVLVATPLADKEGGRKGDTVHSLHANLTQLWLHPISENMGDLKVAFVLTLADLL